MKAIGEIVTTYQGTGGELISLIKWKDRRLGSEIEKLPSGPLEVNLKELGRNRSLRQNRLLWELIGRIAAHENSPSKDIFSVYCELLRLANAKTTTVQVVADAIDDLRKVSGLRALQLASEWTDGNGTRWATCILYLGSSTMSTKEMTTLIDTTIRYAIELGIPTGDLEGEI